MQRGYVVKKIQMEISNRKRQSSFDLSDDAPWKQKQILFKLYVNK